MRNERLLTTENVSDTGAVASHDPTKRSRELYQEAQIRKERLERLRQLPPDDECTFKPKLVTKGRNGNGDFVNKSFVSANNMGGLNGPIREVDESRDITNLSTNVFERLTIDALTVPERQKGRELAERERTKKDEVTGQELFKPVTGRAVRGRAEDVSD